MNIILANKALYGILLSLLLVFANGSRADVDFRSHTFEPPDDKRRIRTEQKKVLTRDWNKKGIVRVAVISDHNSGYKFWSGVQLIDAGTEEVYSINSVECYISFCFYVGKVPTGKYFINSLYDYSFVPSNMNTWASIVTTTAPIRNRLGSFEVKPRSITDLGLIGIYGNMESSKEDGFFVSFLGYQADTAALYDKLYGRVRKYLKLNDTVFGWDDSEWKDSALKKALIERMFFADFSWAHVYEENLLFPSSLGTIYGLDLDLGYSERQLDTLFMLNTLLINGEYWIAGGEAGRVYVSKNRGVDWQAVDAFPRDEVVVRIFERKDVLYAVTASQKQKLIKLYSGAAKDPRFTLVSKTKFKLAGKSKGFLAGMNHAKESLTKMYFNRVDLREIKAFVSASELIVQVNKKQFVSYDFNKNLWGRERRLNTAISGRNVVYMASESYGIPAKKNAQNKVDDSLDELLQKDTDFLPEGEGLFIDRIVPEVHRFRVGGKADSFKLHEYAYKKLSEMIKELEV